MRGLWVLGAAALLLASSAGVRADEEEHEEVEKKAEFVPIKFKEPLLGAEHAPAEYMWEYFKGRGNIIGRTWLKSTAKKDGVDSEISKYDGEWEIGSPSEVAIEGDYALIVKTAARHHAIATNLVRPIKFDGTDKPFVLQYEVRFEEGQTCGGGYVKVLSEGAEKELGQFNDKTPYTIMFGPDKCSPTGKVHLIFRYRNPINGTISEHHAPQPSSVPSSYWDDKQSHLYTLIVYPDGRYGVTVDYKSLFHGSILSDVQPPLEPPKEIADPEDKKPEDWDERAEVEDETATKPEDWDENAPKEIVDESAEKPADWLEDEEALIADPAATKPDDWDEEMDGEWEPPMIDNPACKDVSGCGEWKRPVVPNPAYKGKWRRPRIANPAYKGVWSARLVPNPAYFDPREAPLAGLAPVSALGIELWTMSKAIMFDNILIADSEAAAAEAARLTFDVRRAEEARLRSSKGESNGIFASLVEATEEKPWLWAVYVLCVLVPVILIAVFCFGQKSPPAKDAAYRKKHDDVVDMDDVPPNLVDETGQEVVMEEEEEEGVLDQAVVADLEEESRKKSRSPARKSPARAAASSASAKKKSARQAIEEDASTDSDGAGDEDKDDDEEEEEVKPVMKKRGRPRKAD